MRARSRRAPAWAFGRRSRPMLTAWGRRTGRRLRLHAAATSLLDEPDARLDAVRPGLALYRGAVTAMTRLAEARASNGPIGYTGWHNDGATHGVILAGYSHGLRPGPVLIN